MDPHQSEAPQEGKTPTKERILRWLAQMPGLLKLLGMLLLGGGLGAAAYRLVLVRGMFWLTDLTVKWLTTFGIVLIVLIVGLALLKRYLDQRFATRELAESKELAKRELERLLSAWVQKDEAGSSTEEKQQRVQLLHRFFLEAAKIIIAGMGLRSAISLLAVVLGGTVAFATLLTSFLQIERLDMQNNLLTLQNRLAIQQQEFQAASVRADAAYDQIAQILLDPNATEQAQIFALERIPKDILIAVPHTWLVDDGMQSQDSLEYPNIERLRALLSTFMRQDRIGIALRRTGLVGLNRPETLVEWSDFKRELHSLGKVSEALLKTLHQLGPMASSPGMSLWRSEIPSRPVILPAPREPPAYNQGSNAMVYDLRHLAPEDLQGIQIPFLFENFSANTANVRVLFPDGAILIGARLDGSVLGAVSLRGANLSGASLQGVLITQGDLSGVSFYETDLRQAELLSVNLTSTRASGANLQGIRLIGAILRKAHLANARMEGADLTSAKLDGANLEGGVLKKARLSHATFVGARLVKADLSGVEADSASFTGAVLKDAILTGAGLERARFHGAYMAGADIRGANLSGAQFQAATVLLQSSSLVSSKGVTAVFFHEDPAGQAFEMPAALAYSSTGQALQLGSVEFPLGTLETRVNTRTNFQGMLMPAEARNQLLRIDARFATATREGTLSDFCQYWNAYPLKETSVTFSCSAVSDMP